MKDHLATAAVAVVLLTGCTAAPATSSPPSSAPVATTATVSTPTPATRTVSSSPAHAASTPGGPTYKTVVELKDAAVAAGYACPNWQQDNRVILASGSGSCSTADVFSVYASEDAKNRSIANLKNLIPVGGGHLVVGPQWIINVASDPEGWAVKLGGTPVVW